MNALALDRGLDFFCRDSFITPAYFARQKVAHTIVIHHAVTSALFIIP